MADHPQEMGMDVAIRSRLNAKYDAPTEAEAINWINSLTGANISFGRNNVHKALKNGHILIKLMEVIFNGTANLPPAAQNLKRPFKVHQQKTAFKQMENIENFLKIAHAYGVAPESSFQTVDLYDNTNMGQVLSTILQVGTECQRNGFNGPVCGSRPTNKNVRHFDEAQMRWSESLLPAQSGYNKGASQAGMNIGATRKINDQPTFEMNREGQAFLSCQAGYNKGASQAGMRMGCNRHIADTPVLDMSESGKASLSKIMATNTGASQKGMKMGSQRFISDIQTAPMIDQTTIGAQTGGSRGVGNQAGMRMGGQRFITDVKVPVGCANPNENVIPKQMGLKQNQAATQSGMNMGNMRHIVD